MRRVTLAAIGLTMFIYSPQASSAGIMAKVKSVTTGNTLTVIVDGKESNLRLFGVATPDPTDPAPILKQLGIQADAFLKEFLKDGWVYLEYPSLTSKPDTKGFVDAYVYRGSDAAFVNEKIIREGFGIANRKVPSINRDVFIAVEEKAKAAQRGIWNPMIEPDGQRVAAGKGHQMEYLGKSHNKGSSAVIYWILLFH